jgi:hypothetical protein
MKRLTIDVLDRAYRFIHTLLDDIVNTRRELLLLLAEHDSLPQWNQPRHWEAANEAAVIAAEGKTRKTARRLTPSDLRGQPGLSQAAIEALLTLQPATVREALRPSRASDAKPPRGFLLSGCSRIRMVGSRAASPENSSEANHEQAQVSA